MSLTFPDSQQVQAGDPAMGETKLCSRCRQRLPISVFRLRRKGSTERHTQCRLCFNAYLREYRVRLRHKQVERFTVDAYEAYVHKGARDVGALVSEMLRTFGGFPTFVKTWKDVIDDAISRRRYGTAFRSFNVLVQLIVTHDILKKVEVQGREQILDRLSHEEIVQAFDVAVRRLLKSDPEVAVKAAAALGWKVAPPAAPDEG